MSLRDLGKKAKMDFTYLSKIENDAHLPSVTAIHKLAAALEATPAEVQRLIRTSDRRREAPVELALGQSRAAQILLRRIYSGAVTKDQFRKMLEVVGADSEVERAGPRSRRRERSHEGETLFRRS